MSYDAQQVSRELLFPYLGHQGVILTGVVGKLEFSVEIAGAGAAGSAPKWGPLMRACGMAETLSAGVSAVYAFVSAAQEAASIYFNRDGVRQVLLGARGSCSLELSPQGIPRFRFTFTGLLGTVSDTALPATTLTGFVKPAIVNKANTTWSLHGVSLIGIAMSFDFANQVEPRLLVGYEAIVIVDRMMTGSVTFEADTVAVKDWLAVARSATTGALAITHGLTAGNIVSFAAPAVQLGLPNEGESQKIVNTVMPMMFQPVTGNDEFTITVT
ncbi:hypothetical protein LB513_24400 [Mesorhizobium sp. ES1-1]|nr:phage tail tube protein [Mesorhizobium sp. ES1-1]MBZ9678894.1 hypothetical protein [Mesorhizobium sp. ES1-1]